MPARVTFLGSRVPPLKAAPTPWAVVAAFAGVLSALSSSATALDRTADPGQADVLLYAPNELLVKFKADVSAALQRQLVEGRPTRAIKLTDSLDRLSANHCVRRIAPVFKDFQQNCQRLRALQSRDWTALTETERRLVRRRKRAPANVPVPALDRIYKLELESGVSVEAAVADYSRNPNVEYAETNYISLSRFHAQRSVLR